MDETLERFEELAQRAQNGDPRARQDFYAEAAQLFPLDFGEGSLKADGAPDQLERDLVLIRQTLAIGVDLSEDLDGAAQGE